MKKVLMWAVGVPFLVFGMVMVSFSGSGEALALGHGGTVQSR
ncbi:MAG: hypothetical protein RLZZ618_3825 [Pseudomonadota bacterium]|jgi:hypothetical protein